MIAVVDYRAGNLTSVKKALDHVGATSVISDDPKVVAKADKILLPGVGHFSATATLDKTGLRDAIQSNLSRGTPFLGICVGMQWMFTSSAEAPGVSGLALFEGECSHFPKYIQKSCHPERSTAIREADRRAESKDPSPLKSPHVGWNSLKLANGSRLFRGIDSGSFVYFTHSYRAPLVEATVARCDYGGEFSAAVERDHVFGVQFHPEKSGAVGLAILETFCRL
jgi:imidazole glycerol-phosphate synthase subunit HisH